MKRLPREHGFTLIELLIVVAIIGVVAAIAVPGLLRARISSNETSALGSLRAVWSAQASYAFVCGRTHYASALPTLGVAPGGVGPGFLSPDMTSAATVTKSGFRVTMNAGGMAAAGNDCNGTPTVAGYYMAAVPAFHGTTGNRSFAANQSGTIYFVHGAAAPNPPDAGTPIQ